jgi:hypothetical protein
MGQEGAVVYKDQDQASDQTSKSKPKKAKPNATSDSHRRHWWSPPSWFHKKHDNAAHNQTGKNPDSKTAGVAGPASKTSSSKAGTSTTASAPAPVLKTRTGGTAKTGSTMKMGTGLHTATKTGSPSRTATKKTTQNISSRKKTTVTGKKPIKNDCSPEQAKKGGCQADKGSNQKTTATATAHPS